MDLRIRTHYKNFDQRIAFGCVGWSIRLHCFKGLGDISTNDMSSNLPSVF